MTKWGPPKNWRPWKHSHGTDLIKVIAVVKTCGSCPSQWSGLTDHGDSVYVRFRWGHLSVNVGYNDAVSDGEEVFSWDEEGDGYNGHLTYQKLKELTSHRFEWPEKDLEK